MICCYYFTIWIEIIVHEVLVACRWEIILDLGGSGYGLGHLSGHIPDRDTPYNYPIVQGNSVPASRYLKLYQK